MTADLALAVPRAGFGEIPGVSDSVQVLGLGSSATPWLLQPGETGRIPVYYLGLSQRPFYSAVTFDLGTLTADDARPIDWNQQEPLIRLPELAFTTWQQLFTILRAKVGSTWGDYVRSLGTATELLRVDQAVLSAATTAAQSPTTAWKQLVLISFNFLGLFPQIDGLDPTEHPSRPSPPLCPQDQQLVAMYGSLENEWSQLKTQHGDLNVSQAALEKDATDFASKTVDEFINFVQLVRKLASNLIPNLGKIADKFVDLIIDFGLDLAKDAIDLSSTVTVVC